MTINHQFLLAYNIAVSLTRFLPWTQKTVLERGCDVHTRKRPVGHSTCTSPVCVASIQNMEKPKYFGYHTDLITDLLQHFYLTLISALNRIQV